MKSSYHLKIEDRESYTLFVKFRNERKLHVSFSAKFVSIDCEIFDLIIEMFPEDALQLKLMCLGNLLRIPEKATA